MFRIRREKSSLAAYILIIYGVFHIGYFAYTLIRSAIVNSSERTIIEPDSVTVISKMHFDYGNIALVLIIYIAIVLCGIYLLIKSSKKDKNAELQNNK